MKLTDLIDIDLFNQHVRDGYITVRNHPVYPYQIANYSDKCQYEQMWDEVTMQCRGLIVNVYTLEVIARPFPKFFNYGQPQAAQIELDEKVYVTDRAGGSLGIIYPTPDGYAVATRGSFTSEQAIKATQMLQKTAFYPHTSMTTLVEIVYPDNRIVLDYGQDEKLLMLGGVNIESGRVYGPKHMARFNGWLTRNVVEVFPYRTLAEALAAPPRPNAEGLVVRASGGRMVKIKQESYINLHRIVTGLNQKSVWEILASGKTLDDVLTGIPDEFMQWAKEIAEPMIEEHAKIKQECCNDYTLISMELGLIRSRKDFALRVKDHPRRAILFSLDDNKEIDSAIWKMIKPCLTPQGTVH